MSFNFLDSPLDESESRPGYTLRGATIGPRVGAEKLGASLYELPPGEAVCPYHWHVANEELLVVLDGPVELRDPDGRRELAAGDVVAFPRGERGAHHVRNAGTEPVRLIIFSEMRRPEIVAYPDSGKVGLRERVPGGPVDGMRFNFRTEDAVDYWEGEA